MNTELGRAILKATCNPPQALTSREADMLASELLRLKDIVAEVNAWIVCAAIASAEDMMQNAEHIEKITRDV